MKKAIKISLGISFMFSILIISSCIKEKPTLPLLSTSAATQISYTTAISGGNVSSDGGASITARGICWNTTVDPIIINNKTNEGAGIGEFTSNMTLLTPNTQYFVRAYATNSVGTAYGNNVTLTTSQVALAEITTTAITSITQSSATSGGNISTDNGGSVTSRGVCWSTNQNPTTSESKTSDGTGIGVFTSSISGLTNGTTYYVRSYAINSIGTSYGSQINFKTLSSPKVKTTIISEINQSTATSGGIVTDDGGANIISRGVCWSTVQNPTISDSKTVNGTGTGEYTSSITGLDGNQSYFVRAYATNSVGTSYGDQFFIVRLQTGQISDHSGNIYNTVAIGNQVWLKENLKTYRYSNGEAIPNITNNGIWQTQQGAWRYYNDDEQYNNTYGKLYNWQSVSDTRKICPTGWHVPTDSEWQILEAHLGMPTDELTAMAFRGANANVGGKLKKVDPLLWNNPNSGATDESGFSGLPGGRYNGDATFIFIGLEATFWSSTLATPNTNLAWLRILNYQNTGSYRSMPQGQMIGGGFSIRCLKD